MVEQYVVIVETRPDHNFVVFHIEYDTLLLQKHTYYLFFQDMLSSGRRMKIAPFLQVMLQKGWSITGQSQNTTSLFYTLTNVI